MHCIQFCLAIVVICYVHRNLSSGGIFVEMINEEPRLVVIDFGRVLPDEDDDDGSSHNERVN